MKKVLIFFLIIIAIIAVLSLIMTFSGKVSMSSKVALVRITGVIIDSTETVRELRKYAEDSSVKAVVLRVDSPGGAVAPSQEIYEEINNLKKDKKVIVSMGSVAASGGYYISAPADSIVANAGTLTGSIGVIMEIPNVSGLMEKIGVQNQIVKSGRHKDMASVFRSLGPEERQILQAVLDDVHDQFIEAVADSRGITISKVREIADGRIFTGRMAKDIGLVDELGNLQDAIKIAGKLAGIEGKPQVISKEKKFSFIDMLKSQFQGSIVSNMFRGVQLQYIFSP